MYLFRRSPYTLCPRGKAMAELQRIRVPKDHEFIDPEISGIISVKDAREKLFAAYHSLKAEEEFMGVATGDCHIQNIMGLSDEEMKKCNDKFNPKSLLPGSDSVSLHKVRSSLPHGASTLESFNVQFDCAKKLFHPVPCLSSLSATCSNNLTHPQVLISVIIFHPFKRIPQAQYLVLTDQKLVEFKDKIYCPRDYAIETDFSADPNQFDRSKILAPPSPSKSGYLFINDVFFNDRRHPQSQDYSSVIIDWTSDEKRQRESPRLNKFSSRDMSQVTFSDLKIRLGYPYLYCHHGNCEHIMIFNDIRLLTDKDIQDRSLYPLLNEYIKEFRKRCDVCDELTAMWSVIDDQVGTQSPSYYCDSCHKLMHYDKNGRKRGEFKCYPYFDECSTLLERGAPLVND
ncbi:PREDICTED: snRNA-activating protein complex subunit 3-like [Amphimedon queenslandica]|uniref:snRNA-activating protein complex subunit 3 n=2 Tax=Amphimedon queenslandica TaxID=400682 RepID=A0AAN0IP55_AMPQE|nr:PREDICTED: snRNA-activating protein complex subunit 3-like [Amphimedon queenslandica]|eukprot:XP_011406075.2 PREDICTED: snRNA-activating protein complex subunit 3-like [Amphimedon queenslandica]